MIVMEETLSLLCPTTEKCKSLQKTFFFSIKKFQSIHVDLFPPRKVLLTTMEKIMSFTTLKTFFTIFYSKKLTQNDRHQKDHLSI
jgi:hypothetical protein